MFYIILCYGMLFIVHDFIKCFFFLFIPYLIWCDMTWHEGVRYWMRHVSTSLFKGSYRQGEKKREERREMRFTYYFCYYHMTTFLLILLLLLLLFSFLFLFLLLFLLLFLYLHLELHLYWYSFQFRSPFSYYSDHVLF